MGLGIRMYITLKVLDRAVFCDVGLIATFKAIHIFIRYGRHYLGDGGRFLFAPLSRSLVSLSLPLSLRITTSAWFGTVVYKVLCFFDVSPKLFDFFSFIC